jgi:hypothetical protein
MPCKKNPRGVGGGMKSEEEIKARLDELEWDRPPYITGEKAPLTFIMMNMKDIHEFDLKIKTLRWVLDLPEWG